jgi:hypothetical protein
MQCFMSFCFSFSVCYVLIIAFGFCETKNILIQHAQLLRYDSFVLSLCVLLLFICKHYVHLTVGRCGVNAACIY